jgi:hypothetical protein
MHARNRVLIKTLFPLEGGKNQDGGDISWRINLLEAKKEKDNKDEVVDKGSKKNSLKNTEKEEK